MESEPASLSFRRWRHRAFDQHESEELAGAFARSLHLATDLKDSVYELPRRQFGVINAKCDQIFSAMHKTTTDDTYNLENKYNRVISIRLAIQDVYMDLELKIKTLDPGTRHTFRKQIDSALRICNLCIHPLLLVEARLSQGMMRESLIPRDQPAPLYVGIVGHRFVQIEKKTRIGDISDASLAHLCTEAANMIRVSIDDMRDNSNIDRRLIDCLERYERSIRSDDASFSVERAGLTLEIAQDALDRYKDEISSIHLVSIGKSFEVASIVVNQFAQWRDYKSAKPYSYDGSTAEDTVAVASSLIVSVEDNPEIFDSRIADTIKLVLATISDSPVSKESVIHPLIASLSNMLSTMTQAVIDAIPLLQRATELVPTSGWFVLAVLSLGILNSVAKLVTGIDALRFVQRAVGHFNAKYPDLAKILRGE